VSSESRVVSVQAQGGRELTVMTPAALIERRHLVQQVIEQVMVEGVHYGVIPGTKDLSLLKDGAEVLLSTFNIAVEPIITDLCTPTEVRFQVECRGLYAGTTYVGSGMGVCSSNEEKYRWRKARSQDEYNDAEITHRRLKYYKDWKDIQVRQSPWDVFQTIMSMAKKRAMVDLARTALAASECLKRAKLKGKTTPPAATSASTTPSADSPEGAKAATAEPSVNDQKLGAAKTPALVTQPEANELHELIDQAGIPENAFLARFELGRLEELEAQRFTAAKAWVKANSA
jgi:hypothetical protein